MNKLSISSYPILLVYFISLISPIGSYTLSLLFSKKKSSEKNSNGKTAKKGEVLCFFEVVAIQEPRFLHSCFRAVQPVGSCVFIIQCQLNL